MLAVVWLACVNEADDKWCGKEAADVPAVRRLVDGWDDIRRRARRFGWDEILKPVEVVAQKIQEWTECSGVLISSRRGC